MSSLATSIDTTSQHTTYIQHIYNIYTTYIQHLYNIYTTFIQHLYNIYTTFIQHVYNIERSRYDDFSKVISQRKKYIFRNIRTLFNFLIMVSHVGERAICLLK
jgi:hypothetical protein